jgi:type II secretory pathway pseudopilin PulG
MKSSKCAACGFVGWSDVEHCKACGAPLSQRAAHLSSSNPAYNTNYAQWGQPEGQKKGLAIFALVMGIVSFLSFSLLGIGAITGIIVASIAMSKVKRQPTVYGGRGMALAGLILSIVSFATIIPVALVASIALPNLLAARMAANEASAISSIRQIESAERVYQLNFGKYATLNELAAQGLLDAKLARGTKNGYKFTIQLTSDDPDAPGFAVVSVPVGYRQTGRRSFYIDESSVIRAADNSGGPSTKWMSRWTETVDIPAARVPPITVPSLYTSRMAIEVCTHIDVINEIKQPQEQVCAECVKIGARWVHLRTCQECGGTRCCDSSPNQHASKHARASGHPVIASAQTGERWLYCYPDDAFAEY